MTPADPRLAELRAAAERELLTGILPYWSTTAVDESGGGFFGEVSDDGTPDPLAGKGGVLNARILWTFSAAARHFQNPPYRRLAGRAYEYLKRFRDEEFGGLFWQLDHLGRPAGTRKQTYGQAFGIYGLVEYFRLTGETDALGRAIELFELIEAHAFDRASGGYWEARDRSWGEIDDLRLSELDLNAPLSMNTHLHVLEAYTSLARVWDDPRVRQKLRLLIRLFADRILDPKRASQRLFFDAEWAPLTQTVSYGHDVEASWLLVEAAGVLADPGLRSEVERTAVRMAELVLADGFDREFGGLYYERDGGHLVDFKEWWPQAEGVVGFLNAFELSGRLEFLEAALRTWSFLDRFVVDRKHGEWHTRVSREGYPQPGFTKAGFWKCPYHNARAMLEIVERTDRLEAHGQGSADPEPGEPPGP